MPTTTITTAKIFDTILITTYLFSSIYIFTNTLKLLDNSVGNGRITPGSMILNTGLVYVCAVYGSISVHSYLHLINNLR